MLMKTGATNCIPPAYDSCGHTSRKGVSIFHDLEMAFPRHLKRDYQVGLRSRRVVNQNSMVNLSERYATPAVSNPQ
jgi:hypothetical protein